MQRSINALVRLLLYPSALLYHLITSLRNHLYAIGSKPSIRFQANVIAVGNLSVGGTGKSPFVSYLADYFLGEGNEIASLSRGYRRSTRGFRMALLDESPDLIGDEAAMMKVKHPDMVVSVGEDRALAIPMLLAQRPSLDVILLDDAFQHREVIPTFSILLTTYQHPFFRDHLLPMGHLRESRSAARRADAIIVTKCPDSLSTEEKATISNRITPYAPNLTVYFTSIGYEEPVALTDSDPLVLGDKVIVVSGIADGTLFEKEVASKFQLVKSFRYRDHHHYSKKELIKIDHFARANSAAIVLTEKDAVKWKEWLDLLDSDVYSIPIKVKFLGQEAEFISLLNSSVKRYHKE